tara:strand:- start:1017 stop:1289 length:273 start_codon:yes stop_codon:yes gene_type:complete
MKKAKAKTKKSWKDTHEFYGIKNYTWNKCWDNVRNNGILSAPKFEINMIKKALKSGKLTHTRLVGESLGWLFIGGFVGFLIGTLLVWVVS